MKRMIRKFSKMLQLASIILLVLTFIGCSSNDDCQLSNGMYEYSAEQLQEIYQLQEDYGVTFAFPQSSNEQLADMQQIEDICKIVAGIQYSVKNKKKVGNSIQCKNPIAKTRSANLYRSEFSGSYYGHKDVGTYAIVYYEITWDKLENTSLTGVSCSVEDIYIRDQAYDVKFKDFTWTFSGTCHLDYKLYFTVRNNSVPGSFEFYIYDSCSL